MNTRTELTATDDTLFRSLKRMVAAALKAEGPKAFLDRAETQDLFGEDPEQRRREYWFARTVWNGIPWRLLGRGERALPEPRRNDPCPCGSGRKFKQCCRDLASFPPPPEEAMLAIVGDILPTRELVRLAGSGTLPLYQAGTIANMELERERPKRARDILEAALAQYHGHDHDLLARSVDLLLDALERLGNVHQKRKLLERYCRHPAAAVASSALQRRATIQMDEGDYAGARASLEEARRHTPEDPGVGLAELTLHATQRHWDRVRDTAAVWRRRIQRTQPDMTEFIEMLREAEADPQRAMAEMMGSVGGEDENRLASLIDAFVARPVPAYRVHTEADEDGAPIAFLETPAPLRPLEEAWEEIVDIGKPMLTLPASQSDAAAWLDDRPQDWLSLLEAEPECGDCIGILDDLIRLVDTGPLAESWRADQQRAQLAERVGKIVEGAMAEAPPGATLPWAVTENRPALRALANALLPKNEDSPADYDLSGLRRMLALNPEDNHGFTDMLIEGLLHRGEDEAALEVIRPESRLMPAHVYGRVLALYRLDRREEARAALEKAVSELPKVLDYLLPARKARPKLEPGVVSLGGDDQAWYFRESMRPVFVATPGLMDWLKRQRPRRG